MSAAAVRVLLERARASLSLPLAPLHVIIGNEAADADSLISTLAHACYLSQLPACSDHVLVPVLSCPGPALPLRREASVILRQWLGPAGVEACIGLEEVCALAPPPRAALTLLDHNSLKGPLAALGWGAHVTGIIDHHLDEGAHSSVVGAARAIDFDAQAQRGVGSACSLVALNLLGGGEGAAAAALDAPLAEALLGVIALDTINLLPAKTTDKDRAAVAGLLGVLEASRGQGAPAVTVAGLFASLNALRSDREWWLGLDPAAALALDYKGFDYRGGVLGTTALMMGALDFFQGGAGSGSPLLPARLAAAQALGRSRGADVLAVMSQVVAPAVQRELVLVPTSEGSAALAAALAAALRGASGAHLELEPLALPGASGVVAFQQRCLAHTRKTVGPLLVKLLGELQA